MNATPRLNWIDNLRAIGIVLVLTGHGHANWRIIVWLYSFHVPLFFFLSGYLLSDPSRSSPGRWIRHRPISLGVPYVFLGTINLLYLLATGWFHDHLTLSPMDAFGLHLAGIRDSSPVHGALWFLASLSVGELIFVLGNRHFGSRIRLPISAALAATGYLLLHFRIPVPFSAEISLLCLPFLELGALYRQHQTRINHSLRQPVVFLGLLLASVCGALLLPRIDLFYGKTGNPWLLHVVATCGIFSMLRLAQLAPGNRLGEHLGSSSIAYLGLHLNVVFGIIAPLVAYLSVIAPPVARLSLLWTVEIMACLLLIGPFSIGVSRWIPVLLGGRKR
ncbi:MAG: hypothetical protein RL173_867 [Fibrobacterota bacterium]